MLFSGVIECKHIAVRARSDPHGMSESSKEVVFNQAIGCALSQDEAVPIGITTVETSNM